MNQDYKNIVNYVDELISDRATYKHRECFLSVDDLNEKEQGKLAQLFLESDGRDASDCYMEPNQFARDDKVTCALIKLLKDNSSENREDLASLIFENSINRYKSQMQDVIDERCAMRVENEMFDIGYHGYKDRITGEIQWGQL